VRTLKETLRSINFFKYPKKQIQNSAIVIVQPQSQQQVIRRSRSNINVHNARAARKIAQERKATIAIKTYEQLRRNGYSAIAAKFKIANTFHDTALAEEISQKFEAALLKEFAKNGTAIELKKH
jgi:hypothetical protein